MPSLERAWWRALVAEVMRPADPFERFDQCFAELFDLFRTARGWELDPQARRVLDVLSAEGRMLGVITNFDSRVRDVLRQLGIAPYFRCVILAAEEGVAKPDPAVYLLACARMSTSPEDVFFVDDSPGHVDGAREAGMRGCLFVDAVLLADSLRAEGVALRGL